MEDLKYYTSIYPFLKEIKFEDENGYFGEDTDTYYILINSLYDNCDQECTVYTGATKLVFSFNPHFVVKIPFNTFFHSYQYYSPLSFTKKEENNDYFWDYCAREVYLYKEAKKYNIDFAFAECQYVGMINHWPIYIQETCKPFYYKRNPYQSQKNKYSNFTIQNLCAAKELDCFHLSWLVSFSNWYGIDTTLKLLNFIKNKNINDLHAGNIGYAAIDNRPVIIDFAGFYE